MSCYFGYGDLSVRVPGFRAIAALADGYGPFRKRDGYGVGFAGMPEQIQYERGFIADLVLARMLQLSSNRVECEEFQ